MNKPSQALHGKDWRYVPATNVFDENWTSADLKSLWQFARKLPRKRLPHIRAGLFRWSCKNAAHPKGKQTPRVFCTKADNIRKCPHCGSAAVKRIDKLLIGLGSYSISATKRGLPEEKLNPKDGYVNERSKYFTLADAPRPVKKIAAKLTKMNGGK